MYGRSLGQFISFSFSLALLTILVFGALRWLQIPHGQFIDWIIGALSCWWLLIVVTVPWNVHFEAKSVIHEAEQSQKNGIEFDVSQLHYARKIARISIVVAISLHLFSAAALFGLSYFGISPVGYIGSVAAMLLTGLRPAVSAYQYLKERLALIRHSVKYPREDVIELRVRVGQLETDLQDVKRTLDPSEPASAAADARRTIEELQQKISRVMSSQQSQELRNREEHQKIAHESQNAIARISADTQFLDHVREIVKMIKSA